METVDIIEFKNQEVVFSQYISTTIGNPGETYLFLGVGLDVNLSPRSCSLGFIKTYRFVSGGQRLEFMH